MGCRVEVAKRYRVSSLDGGNVPKQTEEMAAYISEYMKIH